MTTTPKIFQLGAMKPEKGLTPQGHTGWGDVDSINYPGAEDGFPWLEFGRDKVYTFKEDPSVVGKAFLAPGRPVGYKVDEPLNFLARFTDQNYPIYWMMGFENIVKEVIVMTSVLGFTGAGVGNLAYNMKFTDTAPSDFYYLRTVTMKNAAAEDVTYYVFQGSTAPVSKLSFGSGGTLIEFIAATNSGVMYEHIFELDSQNREYRDYTDEEIAQMVGHTVGDKKNLMATLGLRMSDYDFIYPNAMCKDWTYNVKAEDMASWETNFCASDQFPEVDALDSVTYLPSLEDNENVPAHYQHVFKLGLISGGISGMTEVCVTDLAIKCEIPLSEVQTMCSGLHIAEPKLSGAYKLTMTATIPYHDGETFIDYRDDRDRLCGILQANWGWNSIEFLIKKIVIDKSGPDTGDIAAEPLEMTIARCASSDDVFATTLGRTQVHSSPILIRVINNVADNSMQLA